jgi:hypothetical protein
MSIALADPLSIDTVDFIEAWRTLLTSQLASARAAGRDVAAGRVQFEVSGRYFHVDVSASDVTCASGVAFGAAAWIEASASDVEAMLQRKPIAAGALLVTGDLDLVKRMFSAASALPSQSAPWATRLSR